MFIVLCHTSNFPQHYTGSDADDIKRFVSHHIGFCRHYSVTICVTILREFSVNTNLYKATLKKCALLSWGWILLTHSLKKCYICHMMYLITIFPCAPSAEKYKYVAFYWLISILSNDWMFPFVFCRHIHFHFVLAKYQSTHLKFILFFLNGIASSHFW